MEVFVLNEVQSVFKLDALTSSHQISVEVGNPEEIGAIFDKISYGKGKSDGTRKPSNVKRDLLNNL